MPPLLQVKASPEANNERFDSFHADQKICAVGTDNNGEDAVQEGAAIYPVVIASALKTAFDLVIKSDQN